MTRLTSSSNWALLVPCSFHANSSNRKRRDSLVPRGQLCRTKPIITKAQCASISSAACSFNLVNKEIALTKMGTCLEKRLLENVPWAEPLHLWQPLPSETNQRSRGVRTQPEVPQGNAQHGCKQLRMALIYFDGCSAPAGHPNKDLGWFPCTARWKGLFSIQETKGGVRPRQWTWTQNVGNKRTCWWENMQLCSGTCPPQHFHPVSNLAAPRGLHTAALGMAAGCSPKTQN